LLKSRAVVLLERGLKNGGTKGQVPMSVDGVRKNF